MGRLTGPVRPTRFPDVTPTVLHTPESDPDEHPDLDRPLHVAAAAGRLAGRHAFVTGASRGIGRAIAFALAAEGARVTLAATNAALLETAARECPAPGGASHRVQVLDVTDRDACFAAIAAAGPLDVLVNAAGIHRGGPFLDFAPADFRALFEVNVMGTIHLTQAALPGMIGRAHGRVINVASTAGKWASANQSGYNVSKHAVVGLTRCVALEVGRTGVTVNAICPGFVQTDMLTDGIGAAAAKVGKSLDDYLAPALGRVAMGRVLQVDELTGLAVYLASDESRGMTGQSLLIDGGMLFV